MKRTITNSVTAALIAGVASVASAAPQTFPGAMCVSASSAAVTPTTSGQAKNGSAASMSMVCPVVRDLASLSTGNASGHIYVSDGHFNQNVCCSSRVRIPSNGSLLTTASKCSSGVQANFLMTFAGPVQANSLAYRFYLCSVPGIYQPTPTSPASFSFVEGYRSAEL
jgi:hypothetical protein